MQRALPRSARRPSHPFRRALVDGRIARARLRDAEDVKLFALSFAAFFVCFYTFML